MPAAPRAAIASASEPAPRRSAAPAPNGFPPSCRLLRAAEFSAVFEKRKVLRGRWFTVHMFLSRASGTGPRLGLVVPKKLLRTAVARNLTKRLVREAFRQRRQQLPDGDFVFRLTARPGPDARHVDRVALRGEVALLIGKCAGIRGERPAAGPSPE